jgi:hypothetical protein
VITPGSLVRMGLRAETRCPGDWAIPHGRPCRDGRSYAHRCVGDAGHLGKHVCRCGALRRVGL